MATEYIYWGVTAWVGALAGRGDSIREEWRFETREKLVTGDALMTALIKVNSQIFFYYKRMFLEHKCIQDSKHLSKWILLWPSYMCWL